MEEIVSTQSQHTVPDAPAVIAASRIYKTYGENRAVDDVGFSIRRGSCVGFLGPNGAGKTTVMKILYGKAEPDRHHETAINVFGYDPRNEQLQIKQLSGVVTQEDSLDEELNVVQNLRVYAKFYGMSRRRADRRIDELLEFMELGHKAHVQIKKLSGGMQRRLSLARALINDPELVVLDEPTTGLDPQARQHIWQRLRRLRDDGRTLLLTTHYMEEAERLCDRLAIVDGGRIVAEGRPRDLIAQHIEPCVLELRGGAAWHWGRDEGIALAARSEDVGDTLLLYAHDDAHLLYSLGEAPQLEYLSRRANLEDVFLRLTGHELRD